MAVVAGRTSNKHSTKQGSVQRSHSPHSNHTRQTEPDSKPLYPTNMLGNDSLRGRGNGPVQIAVMQQMQQGYGNRAVQRFLKNNLAMQGQKSSYIQAAPSGQVTDPSSRPGRPGLSLTPSIQRENAPKGGSQMAQNIAEMRAGEDVRDRGHRLPDLERTVLHSHFSSPQERRAYTRWFLTAHWQRYAGGQPDGIVVEHQMVYYETLYAVHRGKQDLDSAGSMKQEVEENLKSPKWKEYEQQLREKEARLREETLKERDEQHEKEIDKELDQLEYEYTMERHPVKRAAKVDIRRYPYYSQWYRGLVTHVAKYVPVLGNLAEALSGSSLDGEPLTVKGRLFSFAMAALDVIPGAGKIISAPIKVVAKAVFQIAKATGKASKYIYRVLKGASKVSAANQKLLQEAMEIMKKGGKLSQKHVDAIKEAAGVIKSGGARGAVGTAAKAGPDAVKDAAEKQFKEAAKAGKVGAKQAGKGLSDIPSTLLSLIHGLDDYKAIVALLSNLKDLNNLLPEFKSLADPDKLLGVLLGIEEPSAISKLETWVNSAPTKKSVATRSTGKGLAGIANTIMKLPNAARKVLKPIFNVRAGALGVVAAAAELLEEIPELEQLLGLTDKTNQGSVQADDLMDVIARSASRAVHSKLAAVRSGFKMHMAKFDAISSQELAGAITAALRPLVKGRNAKLILPQVVGQAIASAIPEDALNALNGALDKVLKPLVDGAEKLLDEALDKVEGAVKEHLIPELKVVVQRTVASKVREAGKKVASIATKGLKGAKALSKDPTYQRAAAEITKAANKLVSDNTVINDSSPPQLPKASNDKEPVYTYKWKGRSIKGIARNRKWALLVPKLAVSKKAPKRIVSSGTVDVLKPTKADDDLKKAKAAWGRQLFWREDLQDTLKVSKSTALERINRWKADGVLHQLASGTYDPEAQYSFDKAKAGQREISPGNRAKYGYSNPKKESSVGLKILSKGLHKDSPKPVEKTSADYHTRKARYFSVRDRSSYPKFGFVDAILGHADEGASGHWNRIGHKQSREKNQEWNRNPDNYQGPEHWQESAASGGSSERYKVPSKHIGSHKDWL